MFGSITVEIYNICLKSNTHTHTHSQLNMDCMEEFVPGFVLSFVFENICQQNVICLIFKLTTHDIWVMISPYVSVGNSGSRR